ncbi:MAG: ABC transporter permease [Acidobacteriaceae bacterium]|nr:ABC transporter permease [Acidobacteriaceae bacterium]
MSFWSRLARTFYSRRHDENIDEELQYHLAMKEEDGYDPRAARVRFGNPAKLKEDTRAQGVLTWLESLIRDTRYGFRQLRKSAMLTLVVIFSLALGIGANSAIFSLVDAALLKRLPVKDPQSLRSIEWSNRGWPDALCNMLTGDTSGDPNAQMQGSSIAPRIYRELAKQRSGFAALIGFSDADPAGVAVRHGAAEQYKLQYVSPNFFQGLGVRLRLGRTFSMNDDRVGQRPLVIISDRFWRRSFVSRADVLGQRLTVNNVPAEIIGVASPGFFGVQIGDWVDLYAPLAAQATLNPRVRLDPTLGETDTHWWVRLLGRLRPEINENRAAQQLSARFQHLVVHPGLHIEASKIPKLITSPGERGIDPVGADQSRALWILLLLVGLILLIVCANVANLLLSRAVARQRESAVCLALEAARLRLLRQYLIESLTLAVLGGAAGLLLSHVLAEAIHSLIRADLNIGGFDLHVDSRILIFTSFVSLVTALLFGIAPAWQLAKSSVSDALKANSRAILAGRLRLPRALVVIQIGLSFTVLVAAGLLGRSLTNLETMDIGFNRQNLVYASVNPWSAGYNPEQVNQYVERLRSRVAAIPGVLRAAVIEERPLSGNANLTVVNIPGRPYYQDDASAVLVNHVSDGLFETLGIPLLAGRTFRPGDMRAKSDAVIVDELFAERYYPRRNPIGQQFGTGPKPTEHYRIVGVVKNSRYNTLREATHPVMFRPSGTASSPGTNVNFAIRAAIPSSQLARAIREVAAAVDPAVPVVAIKTQTALIDHLLLSERLLSMLSSAFGVLALSLSAIGLVGLLAYTVARRTNEIGVRMALGASRTQVVNLILKDSVRMVAIGLALGLPGAFFIGRLLRHTLFKLATVDPLTVAISLIVLAVVAGAATWVPASRAARVDPMIALRDE